MKNKAITNICSYLIFFIITTNLCYSQSSTETYSSNDLSIAIFNTQLGKITVYVPTFNANEQFSGRIVIEPDGRSEKQQKKNKSILTQFQLTINSKPIDIKTDTYTLKNIPDKNIVIALKNEKEKILLTSIIELNPKAIDSNSRVFIPPYIVVGDPARINAKLDGLLSNNSIELNDTSATILAESETAIFFKVSNRFIGKSNLKFTNNSTQIEQTIHVLDLEISVGKLSLLRSETTSLSLNITGLEGLNTEVPFTITNNSPSNISLENGNQQQIHINPETDAPTGNYNLTQSIQATQNGSFAISASIIPPKSTNNTGLLCHCVINNSSYLIAPDACKKLGGFCFGENQDENPLVNQVTTISSSYVNLTLPSVIYFENYEVIIAVRNNSQNDFVAAFFSYKPTHDYNWQTIENDYDATDGLTVIWETPTNNGYYDIKATVVAENGTSIETLHSCYLNTSPIFDTENMTTVSFTISEEEIKKALRKAENTEDEIKDIEDEINDNLDKLGAAKKRRDRNNELANELIAIDKILDSIQSTYEKNLEAIINTINTLKKQLPENDNSESLQNAVNNAQSRVDNCKDQLENLKKEQENLEKQLEKDKEELEEHFKEFKKIHEENGYDVSFGYDEKGNFTFKCKFNKNNGIPQDSDDAEFMEELYTELLKLKKNHKNTLDEIKKNKEKIADAEDDCEKLNKALQEAKDAKAINDAKAAAELEADELCRQIKELIEPLLQWCKTHPELCDFKEKIEDLLKQCPKDTNALEDFWTDLNDLIALKKALEDSLAKDAENNQNEIDDIENDISGLGDEKGTLEDKLKKELEDADQLRKQREKEAAEAAAAAGARKASNKKKREKQKKDDDKIKDLIKKAKSDEAGDDAFKNLLKGMGLDLLDEATGNIKLGKIIGGLLVLKDIPDCVCPMLKALRDAIAAKNRNAPEGVGVYVEAYITEWKKCANIPSIASVSVAGPDLTSAINGMTKDQSKNALEALNQAIRIQCKK